MTALASQSLAIGVNWLFSFTVSKLTPIMLNRITYGTYLVFGVFCVIMVTWTYFCLPETKGYALEDIRFLFEEKVCVRAIQDAPGGRLFLGSKRVPSVEELKAREMGSDDEIVEDIMGGIPEWLPCDEIWYAISWFVTVESACWRSWYVCTTKVVRMAENSAACTAWSV